MIIAYGYECYVFKNNICGDRPKVPKGMPDSADLLPPELFMNPRCPLVQVTAKATTIEVPLSEAAKELVEIATAEDHGKL